MEGFFFPACMLIDIRIPDCAFLPKHNHNCFVMCMQILSGACENTDNEQSQGILEFPEKVPETKGFSYLS